MHNEKSQITARSPFVENRTQLSGVEFQPLAAAVSRQTSIKHTLDWLTAHQPALEFTDMVTHDEFSHDFLVRYPGGLWLVFDTT